MKNAAFGLMVAAALAAAGCDDDPASGDLPLQAPLDQKVQNFRADLQSKGFQVSEGKANLFEIDDCQFAIASLGNCLGNNPTAPYVIPTVPLWPDEFADPAMENLLGPTEAGSGWTFRLGEREALVVLAKMPPPAKYFGIETYVFTRKGEINTSDEIYQSTTDAFIKSIAFMEAPNPDRVLTFASIGESNNNVTITEASGAVFDEERYFVITTDAVMQRQMADALVRAGVPDRKQIFVEPVSAQIARLGYGEEADDFMTLIRYSEPTDVAAGDRWRQELPLSVLRVRDSNTTRATEPFPAPTRDARSAESELALQSDLDDLVTAVKTLWNQPSATSGAFFSLLLTIDLIGEHCLERPMNCIGDTQDTDYQVSPTAQLDNGEVVAVVGTLGTATGNATYVSLSVNWIPPLQGVLNVPDSDLAGSAGSFAVDVGNTDKLYVQYFARDCGQLANCVEITEEMLPRGESLKVIQRNYVKPGTARGPDPTLLVNPVLIVLDGNARPTF